MLLRERHARDLARSDQAEVLDDRAPQRERIARSGSWPGIVAFITGALLAAAVVLLIVQNTARVEMEWLRFDVDGPLWMFLGLSFAAGFLSAPLLLGTFRRVRARRRERRHREVASA
jgi:uncharacterized integral membrane protein